MLSESMPPFALDGYEVGELIGFGGCGEVWAAREQASGESVALKRLRSAARSAALADSPVLADLSAPAGDSVGTAAMDRLHREAALLASVRHPHVVRLRAVLPTAEGLVLVLDFAAGGSLAGALGVRGRLSAGEVVTIGAPLAQALADVHARGLVHGDVTPANVLFDAHGKPLLADLGVARLVSETGAAGGRTAGFADPARAEGDAPDAASDVHGLAAVCFTALTGTSPYASDGSRRVLADGLARHIPPALLDAVESALDPRPETRPDAAAFARALFATCTPTPVRLVRAAAPLAGEVTHESPQPAVAPADEPEAVREGGRRWPDHLRWTRRHAMVARRVAGAAAAGGLLAGAVAGGVAWATHEQHALAPVATASAPPPQRDRPRLATSAGATLGPDSAPNWVAVLTELDGTRDAAFVDTDARELDRVYTPDSLALAADRATLAQLVRAGQHAAGLRLHVESAVVVARGATTVTLAVRDTLAAYELIGPGSETHHQPGRDARQWRITLRQQGGAWRIAAVAAA